MEILSRIELPKLLMHFGLPLIGVEIGVAGANNTTDLLKAGMLKMYCVDSWRQLDVFGDGGFPNSFHVRNYDLAIRNLLQFDQSRYEFLIGLSSEMCHQIEDNSLGLAYIDGLHTYEGCKADIENYYPKLVDGGIMGFHDYMNTGLGVNKAVKDFALQNHLDIHYIPETGVGDAGCWIMKPK